MFLGGGGGEPPCLGATPPLPFVPINDVYLLRKLIMNTNEEARELATEARQSSEHLQENVLSRASETLHASAETIQEEARELAAEGRQQAENLHENVLSRASEALQDTANNIQEEARKLATEGRQHAEHLQETVHSRASEELGG